MNSSAISAIFPDFISAMKRKSGRKKDLSDVLDYTEKLNELDTEGLPEMSHPFEAVNRFRG